MSDETAPRLEGGYRAPTLRPEVAVLPCRVALSKPVLAKRLSSLGGALAWFSPLVLLALTFENAAAGALGVAMFAAAAALWLASWIAPFPFGLSRRTVRFSPAGISLQGDRDDGSVDLARDAIDAVLRLTDEPVWRFSTRAGVELDVHFANDARAAEALGALRAEELPMAAAFRERRSDFALRPWLHGLYLVFAACLAGTLDNAGLGAAAYALAWLSLWIAPLWRDYDQRHHLVRRATFGPSALVLDDGTTAAEFPYAKYLFASTYQGGSAIDADLDLVRIFSASRRAVSWSENEGLSEAVEQEFARRVADGARERTEAAVRALVTAPHDREELHARVRRWRSGSAAPKAWRTQLQEAFEVVSAAPDLDPEARALAAELAHDLRVWPAVRVRVASEATPAASPPEEAPAAVEARATAAAERDR